MFAGLVWVFSGVGGLCSFVLLYDCGLVSQRFAFRGCLSCGWCAVA